MGLDLLAVFGLPTKPILQQWTIQTLFSTRFVGQQWLYTYRVVYEASQLVAGQERRMLQAHLVGIDATIRDLGELIPEDVEKIRADLLSEWKGGNRED